MPRRESFQGRAVSWLVIRSVARVEAVDGVLADYATYFGRPVQRCEMPPASPTQLPRVTWSIDKHVMVEFLPAARGPGRLLVHEIGLLKPLKQQLRTRHVKIEYVPAAPE